MRSHALAWIICVLPICHAQLTVGTVEGSVLDGEGRPASARLDIRGSVGPPLLRETDSRGRFSMVLPYGVYILHALPLAATCHVRVEPLQIARCDLRAGEDVTANSGGIPLGAYRAAQDLLFQVSAVVSQPLNFEALSSVRLPLVGGWPAAWTSTTFHLNGLDATDSYQPGRPLLLDDSRADDAIIYREAYAAPAVALNGVDVGIYLRGADEGWHGGLATDDTGLAFAADNLPLPPDRGAVQTSDRFRWFTRDTAEVGGPLTRWADISATGTAEWASQTAPLRPDRTSIDSRILFGNTRGRVRIGRDQLDALYSGSRLDLNSGGWPAGIETIFAGRMMPSFYGVEGFENLREVDHMDLVQAGWTHQFSGRAGVLEMRYGYSTAHQDTSPNRTANTPVRIDLLDPAPTEAPLSNFAIRTRHEISAAQSVETERAGISQHLAFGVNWDEAQPRNRYVTPPVEILTTAGQPAFELHWSVAPETRARVDAFTVSAVDSIRLSHGVALDAGFVLDGARGSVVGRPAAILWTNPSPHIGLAVSLPGFSRLTLRGAYARTYTRLAGRYLDFADTHSLSALVYDASGGVLLQRFGGAYSDIARGLKRPYADEFNVSAELMLPRQSAFSVRLLRRDDKDRIAAVNIGVPPSSYEPVVILDPGPDSLPSTFDDQELTVYAQSPATLGEDHDLLTNPAGLRELSEALIATASTRLTFIEVRASFAASRSLGPTNPGNSVWVNDPGVIGALYSDPNSLIHANGHPYLDRAFIGKFQAVIHTPGRFGSLQISNIVNYFDGLPFARQLLIRDLPQGPFLVDASVRGSPEGGNRAQYVLNWNLRVERSVGLHFGQVTLAADLLNVLNNGNKIVENDLTGPQFNQRPAYAIPPPRTLRLGLHWEF
jgi:hypothetical protein